METNNLINCICNKCLQEMTDSVKFRTFDDKIGQIPLCNNKDCENFCLLQISKQVFDKYV